VFSRLLAVLAVLLSTATVFQGWVLLRWEIEQGDIRAIQETLAKGETGENLEGALTELKAQVAELSGLSFPGIHAAKLKMLLELERIARIEEGRREVSYKDRLKIEPASGDDWLELASLLTRRGAARERVFSALEMSYITEPREINAMTRRIAFSLSILELMPEDKQRQVLRELIDAAPFFEKDAIRQIRSVLETKSEDLRRAVRNHVLATGAGEKAWMKAVGL
jgi:hypothetical protein